MTVHAMSHGRDLPAATGLRLWIGTIRQTFAMHKEYRAVINELSALTERELADIGLHRSKIADVARAAVYGR